MTDYLDPATLTPELLYQLQAETWEQGAEHERERIIALLESKSGEFAENHDWADVELITYFIALIKGENNAE